jgi:integrase
MGKKHRGHGEGSIYQRKQDDRWCASVVVPLPSGKQRRKTIYGDTRKEVSEKLKRLHRDQLAGINIALEQQTVQEFMTRWLEEVVKRQNRERTYLKYKMDAENHIYPHIGKIQLCKLTPDHVQSLLNLLATKPRGPKNGSSKRENPRAAEPLSPLSVSNVRAILRRALNIAMRRGYLVRNVATLVDAPRRSTFSIAPLDEDQARHLLAAVAGHRLEALYRLALSLGLRRGEACGLCWQDIDFEAATLTINGSLQRWGGALHWTAPKTAGSVRTLAVPPVLLNVLREHRARQEQERLNAGWEWTTTGYVFVSLNGTPIEPHNVVRYFKTALKQAGLSETIRFHDLRHSCATILIAQGVHLSVIKDILGHTQISTTANVYGHVHLETQRLATLKMDALFGTATPVEKKE